MASFRAARATPRRSRQERCSIDGRISVAGLAALALNSGPSQRIRICSLRCEPPRPGPVGVDLPLDLAPPPLDDGRHPGHLGGIEDLGSPLRHHRGQEVEVA